MHAHPSQASCVQIFLALFPKMGRAVLTRAQSGII
jgi:hypothetical protein